MGNHLCIKYHWGIKLWPWVIFQFNFLSDFFYIVSREGTKETSPAGGADEPAVITLLHHQHNIGFQKFQFIVILGFVIVKRSVWDWFLLGVDSEGLVIRSRIILTSRTALVFRDQVLPRYQRKTPGRFLYDRLFCLHTNSRQRVASGRPALLYIVTFP